MKKTLLSLIIFYSMNSLALDINNDSPYVVKKGDNLWDISSHFLNDPWEWKTIWKNNQQIKNPDLIYPDDVLVLRYDKNGKIIIEKNASIIKTLDLNAEPVERIKRLSDSIPSIDYNKIEDFNSKIFASNKEIKDEIVDIANEDLIAKNGSFGYALLTNGKIGDTYVILKPLEKIKKNKLEIYEKVGTLKIKEQNNSLFKFKIKNAKTEIRDGYKLIKVENKENNKLNIFPTKPEKVGENAKIIYIYDKINGFNNDIVIINEGSNNKVETGNVFKVVGNDKKIKKDNKTYTLNGDEKALIFVYKVKKDYSYGIILSSKELIQVNNKIKNPF